MKTINNKSVSYITKEPNKEMTQLVDVINDTSYFKLIEECCNRATNPQAGFTYDDIKNIYRVKTMLTQAKDSVDSVIFEDSDVSFIQGRVASFTWRVADIQFVEFMDYIKGL